ncbi:MAG: cytochrome c biogenesis protein CcsA [Alistipes sp.]|nr:cytochrome c biogenesis protein CcsA [Alistipes sp.]
MPLNHKFTEVKSPAIDTLRRTAITLMISLIAVLIAATVAEKFRGTAFVDANVYSSWWFVALWGAAVAASAAYLLSQRRSMRPAALLLHVSLAVITAGAAVTWSTAQRGSMTLTPSDAADSFVDEDGRQRALPFSLRLEEFEAVCYPGTRTPMDYVSRVAICDESGTSHERISMNNILSHAGYRFHQSSFDPSSGQVTLGVVGDRTGIAITYAGYALLLTAMIWLLCDPHGRFRRLLRHPALKGFAACAALLLGHSADAAAPPRTVPRDVADCMGELCVLYNDRIAPLSTLAHEVTRKLSGSGEIMGYTPEQVVAGWLFFYDDWKREAVIRIKSARAREALGIEGGYARLTDFASPLCEGMNADRDLREADEKFSIAAMLASGSMLRIFPCRDDDGSLNWFSPVDNLPRSIPSDEALFVRRAFDYMGELVVRRDWEGVKNVLHKLRDWQQQRAGDALPSAARLRTEILYNRTDCTTWAMILLLTMGLAGFVAACRAMVRRQAVARKWRAVSVITAAAALAYLTLRLSARAYVSGHAPMSDGYETMQFMAWGTLLLSVAASRRMPLLLPLGSIVAALALAVSMMSGANPSITPLMPVLQSPLLAIHVALVMTAYALLAMTMICGAAGLILLNRDADGSRRLQIVQRTMLYPAVMLLAAGIFVGAVWANISWGRYWGWDPKEVWALITMLIYVAALHPRSLPQLDRPKIFHIYYIAAFATVVITYFGVNFLLGGMHSYA